MQRLQRRTRRSASTIGGAARDTIIGRADADRVGARPYRAKGAKTRRSRSRASRRSTPYGPGPFQSFQLFGNTAMQSISTRILIKPV